VVSELNTSRTGIRYETWRQSRGLCGACTVRREWIKTERGSTGAARKRGSSQKNRAISPISGKIATRRGRTAWCGDTEGAASDSSHRRQWHLADNSRRNG
jgi:hypothetical protein